MSDKPSGIDFDRQVFVSPQPPVAQLRGNVPIVGVAFALVVIAGLVFLGYKLLPQAVQGFARANDSTAVSADLDQRMARIESRLDKLEVTRRSEVAVKAHEAVEPSEAPTRPIDTKPKTVYQISPTPARPVSPSPAPVPARDLDTARSVHALQSDEAADREAWQATTDQLAEMAGQVGTQSVAILRNQDELNQLLARTEMETIPFELLRGSNPKPVGPVSLVLKSSNPKTQHYTLCVYVQPACIELKDRALHEVVQFVASRNTAPLEVIATKILNDEILGYLEVPRSQSEQ
jgi:hypothetical protein